MRLGAQYFFKHKETCPKHRIKLRDGALIQNSYLIIGVSKALQLEGLLDSFLIFTSEIMKVYKRCFLKLLHPRAASIN
jgi:hypothetical protein